MNRFLTDNVEYENDKCIERGENECKSRDYEQVLDQRVNCYVTENESGLESEGYDVLVSARESRCLYVRGYDSAYCH